MTPSDDETIFGPLDHWTVTIVGQTRIQIWAHGHRRDSEDEVFVALIRGEPAYERELCRLPYQSIVAIED